jgi:rod shape-determining protein MreC
MREPYSEPQAPFEQNGAGALRMLALLLLAIVLMLFDRRAGLLEGLRQTASLALHPLLIAASAPGRWAEALGERLREREQLIAERAAMERELRLLRARLARAEAIQQQNRRLRALLGARDALALKVQFAELMDLDLGPERHVVLLRAGSVDGVREGQILIDERGVLGQVVRVRPLSSEAILITDVRHAVPVQVERNGLRAIAYGTGRSGELRIRHLPPGADLRSGDRLLTSGLGGVFPAGLMVGTVTEIGSGERGDFLAATVRPAASFDRGTEVLLVHEERPPLDGESP